MGLIKCPECNNEVSDQAKACPKCGYGISKGAADEAAGCLKNIVMLGLGAFCVFILGWVILMGWFAFFG